MLTTLLLTSIILVASILLLSVKILFKKNGRFSNTHIGGNKTLVAKGITCAKTQHREQLNRKTLADRLKEIEV